MFNLKKSEKVKSTYDFRLANWKRQTHLYNVVGMKINTNFPACSGHRTE